MGRNSAASLFPPGRWTGTTPRGKALEHPEATEESTVKAGSRTAARAQLQAESREAHAAGASRRTDWPIASTLAAWMTVQSTRSRPGPAGSAGAQSWRTGERRDPSAATQRAAPAPSVRLLQWEWRNR